MNIGINLNCCGKDKIPLETQIDLMKKNGFSTTFCMSDEEGIDDVIVSVKKAGIEFENLHAPFRMSNAMWDEGAEGDKALNILKESIDVCGRHSIPVLVVHVAYGRPTPFITAIGNERFDKLMAYAREREVTIAYENTGAVGKLIAILERYEDAGLCWDVGHETSFTPGMTYMPFWEDKLVALHLHDNMAALVKDWHMIPFDGTADMIGAAKKLAKAKYGKSIMLEVLQSVSGQYDCVNPEEFYRRAGKAARKFAELVTKFAETD